MPDQKSCKKIEFNLLKDATYTGHRMTAVVTCESSGASSNCFTLMASFGESSNIIGFHLVDMKMEHKQSIQLTREGRPGLTETLKSSK